MAARVPTYDEPQVGMMALPDVAVRGGDFGAAANTVAQQSGNLMAAGQKLADTGYSMEMDLLQQANALRVDDALNQAREAQLALTYGKEGGFQNIRGADALNRQSGKPLSDEYAGTFAERLSGIESGLSNDMQRQAFRLRANDMATQFRAGVMQHETQQFQTYALSTAEGIIGTRQREIGLNYNNPALVADAVSSIRAQTYNVAKLTGKSAEWANTQATKMASNAHLTAINAALESNDPRYADAYLKKFSKDMDADDILRANGLITKQLDAQIGTMAGQKVMAGAMPALVPTDGVRLTNLATTGGAPDVEGLKQFVMQQESGGKRYSGSYGKRNDGTEKGSGFLGELKMKDGSGNVATEISVGVNINGKETEIPALVPTLTKDEINHLLQGKEPTDEIVKKAAEHAKARIAEGKSPFANSGKLLTSPKGAKGEMQVMDGTNRDPGFGVRPAANDSPDERARVGADYLGAMLKKYGGSVPQALAAYNAGPGRVDEALREANKAGTPNQWLAFLPKETQGYVANITRAYNGGAGKPQMPSEFELHQQVDAMIDPVLRPAQNKAAKQVVTQQYADIQKAEKQAEERNVEAFQSALIANGGRFSDVPLNVSSKLPPGQYDNMLSFANKIAEGKPIQTDWSLYYKLKTDPSVLSQTNLLALRDKLSDSDFKSLTTQQQDLRNGKDDALTSLQSARDTFNLFMKQAGIDPNPKEGDKGAETVGRILAAGEQRINARERELGRKLKPEEIRQEAAALFQAVEVDRPFWFNPTAPVGAVSPGQVVVVPDTDRRQITEALRRAGRVVNDQVIQDIYRKHKGIAPRG